MHQPLQAQHAWLFLISFRVSLFCLLNCLQTLGTNKINCLPNIKTLREPCMVGFEKSADIISRSLVSFINFNSSLFYFQWIKHECNSIKKFRMACFLFDKRIKFLFVGCWNHIPCFDLTFVTIVDRVKPKVFNMPTECRKHHSHVNPWNCYSTYEFSFFISNFQYRF